MRTHVTVVPMDGIIIVHGLALNFAFSAPANLHALQWHDGAGESEWKGELNHSLTSQDYETDVAPFVALWEAEKARLDAEANRKPTLEEAKAAKFVTIDAETSASILAGFDYAVNGTDYHFSYDTFDQQNFADTANVCALKIQGVDGLPDSVMWNSYSLVDGGLVRQTFTAQQFLSLYTGGAMAHKNTAMQTGGARKATVEAATTLEEVAAS